MSWKTEIIEQVRIIINDIDSPQTYTDSRIERVVIIAAFQSLKEIDFSTTYSINIATQTISPDPTSSASRDADFINLVSLKTACLMLTGELRKYSLGSVSITDGPSTINMGQVFTNLQKTYNEILRQYEKYKVTYQSSNVGQAVSTPTTVQNIYPTQGF